MIIIALLLALPALAETPNLALVQTFIDPSEKILEVTAKEPPFLKGHKIILAETSSGSDPEHKAYVAVLKAGPQSAWNLQWKYLSREKDLETDFPFFDEGNKQRKLSLDFANFALNVKERAFGVRARGCSFGGNGGETCEDHLLLFRPQAGEAGPILSQPTRSSKKWWSHKDVTTGEELKTAVVVVLKTQTKGMNDLLVKETAVSWVDATKHPAKKSERTFTWDGSRYQSQKVSP
jgi:hypothetical protein